MLVSGVEKRAGGAEARKGITPWSQIKSSQGAPVPTSPLPWDSSGAAWHGLSPPGVGAADTQGRVFQPCLPGLSQLSLPRLQMSGNLTGKCLLIGEEEKLVF